MKFEERRYLFSKFIKKGLSEEEASARLKNIEKDLHELVLKLRKKRMSEKDIDSRFKEEFAKICEK